MTSPSLRAACLTPPAIGGIAVIQIVGHQAVTLVGKHLRKGRSPVDLSQWPADVLRLCRLIDSAETGSEETIDDAVVCIRRSDGGTPVIDLNLHGGARIVQRVLLMLQRQGVQIVPPTDLLLACWPSATRLHDDAMRLLLQAKTRRTAIWLARLPDTLAERLGAALSDVQQDRVGHAIRNLDELLAAAERVRLLIGGVRAVLIGPPNSGKSTLANALAEREHAVVSDTPGTTRDWTEHPAAIDGVPFALIDTAGIRHTDDPIEAEAIRRARRQVSSADVIIRVDDLSKPPDLKGEVVPPAPASEQTPVLDVYNKVDLPAHAGWSSSGVGDGATGDNCATGGLPASADTGGKSARATTGVRVSARTGEGIDLLRARLLERIGLPIGVEWPIGPFTTEQVEHCRRAREALMDVGADRMQATRCLQNIIEQPTSG
jgi:tRNA modification GTPase